MISSSKELFCSQVWLCGVTLVRALQLWLQLLFPGLCPVWMIKKIYGATSRFVHRYVVSPSNRLRGGERFTGSILEHVSRICGNWWKRIIFICCRKMLCISLKCKPKQTNNPLKCFKFYNYTLSFCFQVWFKAWTFLSEALDDLGPKVGLWRGYVFLSICAGTDNL